MKKILLTKALLLSLFMGLQAQTEICNNGRDDDGDDLIDFFDPDCGCERQDAYYYEPQEGCNENCVPNVSNNFTMQIKRSSSTTTAPYWHEYSTPIVADANGDGFPEIVGKGRNSSGGGTFDQAFDRLLIYDGRNLAAPTVLTVPSMTFVYDAVAIADLDRNGFAEIIIMAADGNTNANGIGSNIYNANRTFTIPTTQASTKSQIPGNTIVGATSGPTVNAAGRLICYEWDDALKRYYMKWISDQPATHFPTSASSTTNRTNNTVENSVAPSIADFNHDGIPEIYVQNRIFNSNGRFLAGGPNDASVGRINNVFGAMKAFSVAADVDGTDDLELVCGNTVYTVDIVPNGTSSVTVLRTANGSNFLDGWTSVADMNGDGQLDVIVSSQDPNSNIDQWTNPANTNITNSVVNTNGNITTTTTFTAYNNPFLYIWNPRTGAVLGSFTTPGVHGKMSQANIGNFDDDDQLEIGVSYENGYVILNCVSDNQGNITVQPMLTASSAINQINSNNITNNLTMNPARIGHFIATDGSGETGSTLYDFNGDGIQEVVYRDEDNLHVISVLADGNVNVTSAPCQSNTSSENPVVVDVDGDGETEIVCSCRDQVVVFSSNSTAWIPTRSVWNQHSYFNVNINDDLTVPTNQQRHDLVGNDADSDERWENFMNNFLVQIPRFQYADANITFDGITCDENGMSTIFTVCNDGQNTLPARTPISFYDGDPRLTNAIRNTDAGAQFVTTDNIAPGECKSYTLTYDFPIDQEVFAMVNDNGNTATPFVVDPNNANGFTSFPNTTVMECNFSDNITSFIACCGSKNILVSKKICDVCEPFVLEVFQSRNGNLQAHEFKNVNSCDFRVNLCLLVGDQVVLFDRTATPQKRIDFTYDGSQIAYENGKSYFDFSPAGEENYSEVEFVIDNSENCGCDDLPHFLRENVADGTSRIWEIPMTNCEGSLPICARNDANYTLFTGTEFGPDYDVKASNVSILGGVVSYNREGYMKTEPFDVGKCCPSLENADPDHLLVFSNDVTITTDQIWDHKVYVADGVTVTIDGATLDVTNVDVIFGECAGITFINDAVLRSTNSVYRPCAIDGVWKGLRFEVTETSDFLGFMNTSTIKNAFYGIQAISSSVNNFNLRITNNTFINCYHSIDLQHVKFMTSISGNTFNRNDLFPLFYDDNRNMRCIDLRFFMGPLMNVQIMVDEGEFVGSISNNTFTKTDEGISQFGTYHSNLLISNGIAMIKANRLIPFNAIVTNNDFTGMDRALFVAGSEVVFEGNRIFNSEVNNNTNNGDFLPKVFVFGSNNIKIQDNELVYSGAISTQVSSGGTGVAGIEVRNSSVINIRNNVSSGYETGLLLRGVSNSNVSDNLFKNYWYYGIYAQDCFENLNISCNTLDGKLILGRQCIGVGIINSISGQQLVSNTIKSNCISEHTTAIHVESPNNVEGPIIANNFLYNYTQFGVRGVNVDLSGKLGSGLMSSVAGKNTFTSNNITNNAVDVASTNPVSVFGNYGISTVSAGVTINGSNLFSSSASCGGQIGPVSNQINHNEVCDILEGNTSLYVPQVVEDDFIDETEVLDATEVDFTIVNAVNNELVIYPNPAVDEITIEVSTFDVNATLELHSISGQFIRTITDLPNMGKINIDIDELAPGVYYLNLISNNELQKVGKFIKK